MSHHDIGKEFKERKVRLSTEAVQKATMQEAMLKQAAEAAARTEKVQNEEQARRAAAEKLSAARKQAEEQEAEAIRKQLEEFQKKRIKKEKEITRQAEEQEAEEIRKEIERFKEKEQLRQRELEQDKDPLTKREQAKDRKSEWERERERVREREAAAEEGKRKAEEEERRAAETARKRVEENKQREEEKKREVAKNADDSAQERGQVQAVEPAAKVGATGGSNVDLYLRQRRSTASTETSPRSPPGSRTTSSLDEKTKHNTTVGYYRGMDCSPLPTVISGQSVVDKKMEYGGKGASESIRERVRKGPTPDKGAASPHAQPATVESPRPLTFNPNVQPLTVAAMIGKLKDVVSFFDQGLFSKEEFSQRRQEILGNVEQPASSASPTPLPQSVSKSPLQSPRVPSQNSAQAESTFKDFVNQSSGAKASPVVRAAAASTPSPQKTDAVPPGFRRGASAKKPGQLWDDAAFSKTLVAAAAKLSAMKEAHAVQSSPRNESHQSLYPGKQLGHKTPVVASGLQSADTRQKEPNLFASLSPSPSPSPSLSSETRQKEPNLFAARDSSFYERLAETSPAQSPRATSILRGNILDMPMQALTTTVTSVVTQSCVLTPADSDTVLLAIPN